MNRIWKYLNEEKPDEEQPVARDYWVVRCYGSSWHVRAPQALRIRRVLERRWKPKWLEFRDVAGSRIRVRTAHVVRDVRVHRGAAREGPASQPLPRERGEGGREAVGGVRHEQFRIRSTQSAIEFPGGERPAVQGSNTPSPRPCTRTGPCTRDWLSSTT